MKKLLKYFLFGCIVLVGCNKYLDINPSTTSVNPSTIKDFQEMLNNDSLVKCYNFLLDLTSDDVRITDYLLTTGANIYSRTYKWNSAIWNVSDTDFIYNTTYTRILQMNVILSKIEKAPNDSSNTIENKSNVISQALINRASFYLQLANTYGPAYIKSTELTDLTVPLILVPQSAVLPARASMKGMYDLIVTDLKKAVNNAYLPAKGVDVIHPGKAAGYALLSRAYLFKSQYDSSLLYADSSLRLVNTIVNYNTSFPGLNQLVDLNANPEVLLGRASVDAGFYAAYSLAFKIDYSLLDSLGTSDLRYSKKFSYDFFNISNSYNPTAIIMDNSVSVPEVLLNKAECLARTGNTSDAADIIKRIRQNRLPSTYNDNRTYTSANTLNYVLGERRRELFCHGGLRLFDIKRLNKIDNRNIVVYRKTDYRVKTDSLMPNSNRYVFPFAAAIVANNPNIAQNPR